MICTACPHDYCWHPWKNATQTPSNYRAAHLARRLGALQADLRHSVDGQQRLSAFVDGLGAKEAAARALAERDLVLVHDAVRGHEVSKSM